ncbi:MAG: signal peptidase I [Micrococcales bacterium]|nr:signal peptidase I [Micrococcales bacterium]
MLVILVAAVLISFLIKTFLIRSFYIPSESMMNTLHVNDRIIVNELAPKLMPVQRGDVIVFRDPGGWLDGSGQIAPPRSGPGAALDQVLSVIGLTAPDSNDHLIKRVIGLPGDKVTCCTSLGRVSVNGVPLTEPYILVTTDQRPFSVTVPKKSLWVMGDNRGNSKDSRFNQDQPGKGFVPYSDVVGRAILISWPADRWTWLDNYPFVFANVDRRGSG